MRLVLVRIMCSLCTRVQSTRVLYPDTQYPGTRTRIPGYPPRVPPGKDILVLPFMVRLVPCIRISGYPGTDTRVPGYPVLYPGSKLAWALKTAPNRSEQRRCNGMVLQKIGSEEQQCHMIDFVVKELYK